jgi:hypothetical protein
VDNVNDALRKNDKSARCVRNADAGLQQSVDSGSRRLAGLAYGR